MSKTFNWNKKQELRKITLPYNSIKSNILFVIKIFF